MITVYGIPHCDSVKKGRARLAARGLAHTFYDFKKQGVPADRLAVWSQAVGWEKLLNRQGSTWRKLDSAMQASAVNAGGAAAVMRANPSVVKRPVVEWDAAPGGRISVGFDALQWAALVQ